MVRVDPHVRVNVSFAQSLLLKLDELAGADGLNRSQMIKALIAGVMSRRVEQRLEEQTLHVVVRAPSRDAIPACSFCQRVPKDGSRLLASGNEIAVCERCVAVLSWNPDALTPRGLHTLACSFCGASHREMRWLAQAPEEGAIRSGCVDLCRRIFSEDGRV